VCHNVLSSDELNGAQNRMEAPFAGLTITMLRDWSKRVN
jgi:hypothetical protein